MKSMTISFAHLAGDGSIENSVGVSNPLSEK